MFPYKCVIISFLFTSLLFSSCVTSRKVNYLQKPSFSIPKYATDLKYEDYRLRSGDKLSIKVYSLNTDVNNLFKLESGLNNSTLINDLYAYIIDDSGSINMPLLGTVCLGNKTIREAKVLLDSLLALNVNDAIVDLHLLNRSFSVIGVRSGSFDLPREKVNIFEALALAGDVGFYGDRSKIRIIRKSNEGDTKVSSFDIRSQDIINSEFYYVQPNDVIYIQNMDESFFGISDMPTFLSTVFSTISFVTLVYNLVD